MDEFGDKVRVVFKHNPLPFHADAPLASAAALAAGAQGKFWEYHDKLFDGGTKSLGREHLDRYAKELELDLAAFGKALDEDAFKDKIAEDQELAAMVQARGTPNHFINGRNLNGAAPFEDFKKIIDDELKKTSAMLESGTTLEALYPKLIASGKNFNPLDPNVKAINPGDSPRKGKAGARIAIVEFSDFECPYCSRVGGPLKRVVARYPNDVSVSFKQFPLGFHKNAQKAAEAALAAHAQGRFWDMHDILFDHQKELQASKLGFYAEQIGLDMDQFTADLKGGKFAATVRSDMAEGRKAGVRGTPSVFINGRKFSPSGGYTVEGIEKVLKKEFGLKLVD